MNAILYDMQVVPVAKYANTIETYILCASMALSLHISADSDRQHTSEFHVLSVSKRDVTIIFPFP